jgi:hypothetical protein
MASIPGSSGPRPYRSTSIMELRARGMKTEPAFANILALPGDPYVSLLELGAQSDAQLLQRIVSARARRARP